MDRATCPPGERLIRNWPPFSAIFEPWNITSGVSLHFFPASDADIRDPLERSARVQVFLFPTTFVCNSTNPDVRTYLPIPERVLISESDHLCGITEIGRTTDRQSGGCEFGSHSLYFPCKKFNYPAVIESFGMHSETRCFPFGYCI